MKIPIINPENVETNVSVHLLPCNIKHNGPANVSKFFDNYNENNDVLRQTFRGRPLQGKRIKLERINGYVVNDSNENVRQLTLTHTFDTFKYWNLDEKPSDGDVAVQGIERFFKYSQAVHKPVDF